MISKSAIMPILISFLTLLSLSSPALAADPGEPSHLRKRVQFGLLTGTEGRLGGTLWGYNEPVRGRADRPLGASIEGVWPFGSGVGLSARFETYWLGTDLPPTPLELDAVVNVQIAPRLSTPLPHGLGEIYLAMPVGASTTFLASDRSDPIVGGGAPYYEVDPRPGLSIGTLIGAQITPGRWGVFVEGGPRVEYLRLNARARPDWAPRVPDAIDLEAHLRLITVGAGIVWLL